MCRQAIIIVLVFLTPLELTTAKPPTASQLLAKFTETQDKIRSFRIKGEISVDEDNSFGLAVGKGGQLADVRFDGERMSRRTLTWGNIRERGEPVLMSDPSYTSHMWDGQDYWRYSRGPKSQGLGRVIINKKQNDWEIKRLQNGHVASPLLGFFSGAMDRADVVLREARNMSVRDKTEQINGVDCYVVDADTNWGKYTVWLDPEHGHNIAKAIVLHIAGENHLFFGRPFEVAGRKLTWSIEIARFKEIDGVWVAVEAYQLYDRDFGNGNYEKTKTHTKLTEVILNPEHDSLGSFAHDNIPNGTPVYIVQVPSIQYTWQDGELIPDVDEAVITEIDKITEEIMAKGEVPPSLKDKKEPGTVPATVSDLLDKYAASQDKLQSFIAKGTSETEIAEQKQSRKESSSCEFRTDGNKVSHRATFWDNLTTTRDKPGYKSFLWDGKSLIEYKQQSPALGGYRVFIENKDESKKKLIATQYKGAALMGICAGDYERVDSILRKSDTISVLDRTERVGDANCYVIDAATKRGRYKLWLDPQHDYNIAKMEVQRKKGDLVRNTGRVETSMSFVLDGVGFKKVGDVWVSMEADMRQEEDNRAGVVKWHHKRIEMVLNPDHNVLHSFVADDIPDGTKVSISGLANTEYTWRNGKPVQE
jgi:hypothetical protein